MLPQIAIDSLLRQRERQEHARLKAVDKWQDLGLVFTNMQGGFMSQQYHLYEKFKQVLKKAGVPDMRFHDLRHSAATILLLMNVHPKQVQELLRHSTIATTMNKYGHVLPSMQRKMMDDVDDFYKSE